MGKVVTFKLGADMQIAEPETPLLDRTPKADPFGDTNLINDGLVHYSRNCMVCHGPFSVSSGVLPDLRWSLYTASAEAWKGVLIDGNLSDIGMVSFADVLSEADAEAIRAYILAQAHSDGDTGLKVKAE